MKFPVKLNNGSIHDLDDLSSGEKEILFGYLRIRNSTPSRSIVLIDEPELHLNPRLTRGLIEFYYEYLANKEGHQIWLITHSDAILREAVTKSGIDVFHMASCSLLKSGESQTRPILIRDELTRAIVDLVGAAYAPGGKNVIIEGEQSEFDKYMISTLFPDVTHNINLISAANVKTVHSLHTILERLQQTENFSGIEVYSIIDQDSGNESAPSNNRFMWDRYHIENYLLDADIISTVANDLRPQSLSNANDVEYLLQECAKKVMPQQIRHAVSQRANKLVMNCISFNNDPQSSELSDIIFSSVEQIRDKIASLAQKKLSQSAINDMVADESRKFENSIDTGRWRSVVRGRDILKRFSKEHFQNIRYDVFRNLIVAKMRDRSVQPVGMKSTIGMILK